MDEKLKSLVESNGTTKEMKKRKHHKAKSERPRVQFHQDETIDESSSSDSSSRSIVNLFAYSKFLFVF
mgnify:CR=1 FL=1